MIDIDGVSTPSAQEVAKESAWVLPPCKEFPSRSPGEWFYVDCLDILNKELFEGMLFPGALDKQVYVVKLLGEAHRVKKLVGKARRLMSGAPGKSHIEEVQELKDVMVRNPKKRKTEAGAQESHSLPEEPDADHIDDELVGDEVPVAAPIGDDMGEIPAVEHIGDNAGD